MQRTSSGSAARPTGQTLTPTSPRGTSVGVSGGLPAAPSLQTSRRTSSATAPIQSQLTQNMAQSMTIEEMRFLHQRALSEADAKRTELRLVLASRYRELVGSSDEVLKMKERSQELHDLVDALPLLISKLTAAARDHQKEAKEVEQVAEVVASFQEDSSTHELRRELSILPRSIYRALAANDVYTATVFLIQLFTLIASQTDLYLLANALSMSPATSKPDLDPLLEVQIRMTFLQMQTLPDRIRRTANGILARAASYGVSDPSLGAQSSAAALGSLHFLEMEKIEDRAERLLSSYFESKAKLLVSLLGKLTSSNDETATNNAEEILSKIVLILQHDIVVHSYQIFVIRKFPGDKCDRIMSTLPLVDKELVKAKCSKFLVAHLPLIRSKVKSVLVTIAGTTASALGQIRQSLYDKTDGAESMIRLNENSVCTWDEAVFSMIDIRAVLNSTDADATQQHRFSLWGALFSNTFSSLVHSLLTTSFQSVHTSVVQTLRVSLANAPPVSRILPHEAYRNALKIAMDLDRSLLKVSQDAHELLVHAEERVESERRLRQSLYVQTCEIMGRLICELRRMALRVENDTSDATKELIVGRLCFLLKFRLTSLRTLLCPDSSPASIHGTGGMISYVDLQSAFELADDNEDGLISFEEAMDAVESAFSGSPFHGAEMVCETLLLSKEGKQATSGQLGAACGTPTNVTLSELTLLTARGLRHDEAGALRAVQMSLDNIVDECFQRWAKSTLFFPSTVFEDSIRDFILTASSVPDDEWLRLFSSPTGNARIACRGVSPYVVGFFLDAGSALNGNTCPSDCLSPVPKSDDAAALGILTKDDNPVATLMETMRWALLSESIDVITSSLENAVTSETGSKLEGSGASALLQLHVDVSFVKTCYQEKNRGGLGTKEITRGGASSAKSLETVMRYTDQLLRKVCDEGTLSLLPSLITEKHQRVLETSDLFFSSVFGDGTTTSVSPAGELMGSAEGTEPLFHIPLASSRRFALLPVQADRSLHDIQLRGKYEKEKEEAMDRHETTSGNVISGGFGFLSSMLKTKK